MALTPYVTHWFEVVCPRNDVARAAEALAATDHVQVEGEAEGGETSVSELLDKVPAIAELERRYARYWPDDVGQSPVAIGTPEQLLNESLESLARWAEAAEPLIARLQTLELQAGELERRDEIAAEIGARQELDRALEQARRDLEQLHEAHGVRGALGTVRRLRWYVTCVPALRHTRHFALITGWTDAPDPRPLEQALSEADICALVSFTAPPADRVPPMVLHNPWWARPFEVFARLVGVPRSGEVDPSALLSVIAPLIFGFMFGDVGHGFVVLVAGLLLRKRVPQLALLVPGGLSAMFFGLLFGSVFGVEHLIPALWIHPMKEPLTLLLASVLGGAAVLIVGLGLGGVGAVYQRRFGRWLATDAAVIAIYLGALLLFVSAHGAWLAIAGIVWFAVGHAATASEGRVGHALAALGELVEGLLQLGVNTVSFARVGAFALAHAGLSAAMMAMLAGTDSPVVAALIVVLGNAVVVLIEGLVVSIQTTRLVLFEFFVRFFKAGGRPFAPLKPPVRDDHEAALPRRSVT